MLTIKDKNFVPFIDQNKLKNRIVQLADQINHDYRDKEPLLVVVLNGAFIFAAELMTHLTIPCRVTFIRVSSYQQTASTGVVRELLGLSESIAGQDVILIEDIIDTGLTIQEVSRQLMQQQPTSLEIATMLFKPEALKVEVDIKYIGFEIENQFVVGYGLDYDGFGRNAKEIFVLA
ncbi:hypoxanthine phosphoribosyltransferase [Larkinella arboricola]|uniref:Hypoxanthine phosphoribosyltransferase n=1 Tax=Larkinella arboricola TaxID=643671 RepID=A0A327X5H1_LARAB|nr:hypoxanthine phosphoribosyltransferase [Larkinella arboricola]RAK02155.1 hypoxanthine phosphoribosyltransferase [Larkinella arboricola]